MIALINEHLRILWSVLGTLEQWPEFIPQVLSSLMYIVKESKHAAHPVHLHI